MIRLIVNADDLGSSAPRDRGIFTAFAAGIVTSASLLANGRNFVGAAAQARACNLPVGVHLNLSEGQALSGAIPGLTDPAGSFPGKMALRDLLGKIRLDEDRLRRELLAQIDRVRGAGLAPDHLDTHQHCMLFPALTEIIADVAEVAGITALRLPQPAEPGSDALPGELGKELNLYASLAPAARRTLQRRKLWTPDGLWGMPLLNRLNPATLTATLEQLPQGTWELMTHPGYGDGNDPFGGPEREAELLALTDPAVRELIAARQIVLTNFGACACAC